MRTVVFINAHSRRGAHWLPAVQKFFNKHADIFELVDFVVVEKLENFQACLDRLQEHENIECAVVGGGDGTITTVLNALKQHKNVVYGFLPLGTTNVFARNLGLPLDVKKALLALTARQTRQANLGSVNGVLFVNVITLGLSAEVVKSLGNRFKRYLGPFAYNLSALRLLPKFKPVTCQVQIDNDLISFRTYDLLVANGRYYGTVTVNKAGSVYSNNLTVMYSAATSGWDFFKDACSFMLRLQHRRQNITIVTGVLVGIQTKSVQAIEADGEIVTNTPAEVRVVKDAIRVLVPPERKRLQGKRRKARRSRKFRKPE